MSSELCSGLPELSSREFGIALVLSLFSKTLLYSIYYLSLLYIVFTLCNTIMILVLLWFIIVYSYLMLDCDLGPIPVH